MTSLTLIAGWEDVGSSRRLVEAEAEEDEWVGLKSGLPLK